jgi:PTS system fructose-specific IIC component
MRDEEEGTKDEAERIKSEVERMRNEMERIKPEVEKTRNEMERIKPEVEKTKDIAVINKNSSVKILAVTGCPTGIAHTYMAAEALQKSARKKGVEIKVETRGSGGAKNVLTDKEIEEAVCIIVASDTKVPMDRFSGKKVISCQVSDGISKADELVERAINGEANVFKTNNKRAYENTISKEGKSSFAHQIYTHLMNGVSHMLPFVVGGGILIALAFLIDGLLIIQKILYCN